jgi:GNAT superfamily N-acetyltransferase
MAEAKDISVYYKYSDCRSMRGLWTAEQKQAFLAQQFAAQRKHYRETIENCRFDALEYGGEPIGRLYLQNKVSQIYIVDITLLSEWRGKSVGTAILEALQEAAVVSGRGVGIFVEKFNPALKLYRRLDFAEVADHGVYLEMEWLPPPRQAVS